jgi:myo-inositol-1(or 4)-monophosphatase
MTRANDLKRIQRALVLAGEVLEDFTPGRIEARQKAGGDPVTEADLAVNEALLGVLPSDGEGWLSEETKDDSARLGRDRVWVVDPIDGTREFVMGIPEWCVSIGLVEGDRPVAGGIFNPATGQKVVGSAETGVTLDGEPVRPPATASLAEAVTLASRSEVKRGEWAEFEALGRFTVRAMGSVAYKLSLVAAGLADATWTLVPKHEWDVAAGVALVEAAGGSIRLPGTSDRLSFNRPHPKLPGLIALAAGEEGLWEPVAPLWKPLAQ